MLNHSYKKNIAEGKSVLIFSIVFAVFMRTFYFYLYDLSPQMSYGGYLWPQVSNMLSNHFVSFMVSNVFVLFIAFFLAYINNRFAFIRENTSLPFALALLIFSSHPSFILMNPAYAGLVALLYCIVVLFDSYNGDHKQLSATKIAFALAVGSLFVNLLWLLLPLFWVGLGMMHSLSFKAILASFFGLVIEFFPIFSYYLYFNRLDEFCYPFLTITDGASIAHIPLLHFDKFEWAMMGFTFVLLFISIADALITAFKDKIRVRSYFNLLCVLLFLTAIVFLVYNPLSVICLYFMLGLSPMILSHFFTLNHNRSTVLLFYFSFSMFLIICILPFV